MAAATYEDVAVAIGRPISDAAEQARVTYWIDGVELMIRTRLGDVTLLDQDVLKFVETESVAGKVRRAGDGASSVTVSVDDGSVTRRYEGPAITASDLVDEWWDMLDPGRGASGFSTRPGFESDTYTGDIWSEIG